MKDFDSMFKIAERAEKLYKQVGIKDDRLTIVMDIDNADQSVGMDLRGLADASDSDFAHDVLGIRNHMNRKTGQLEGCFLPRYARQ